MRNKILFLALFITTGFLFGSCKKKSPAPAPVLPVSSTSFYNMGIERGNYWIYQQYLITDTGIDTLSIYDSCYVGNDTLINGNTYHTWYSPGGANQGSNVYQIVFLRDSGTYVVDNNGNIIFSPTDFTDIFRTIVLPPNVSHPDTITVTTMMAAKDSSIIMPAGTFTTSTLRSAYRYPPGSLPFAVRNSDRSFAYRNGLVRATAGWYDALPQVYEWRLVRCHIKPTPLY